MPQILQIKPYFVNSFEYVISYESLHWHFYFFIAKLWDHSNFIWSEYTLTDAEAVSQRWPATLSKKGFWHRCFPVKFVKFKSTCFNRTPSVAASARDKFLVRFFRKELFFLPQNLFIYYFNVSKLSFNLQFFIFYLKCFSFYSLVFGSLTQFFIFLISTVNILKVS